MVLDLKQDRDRSVLLDLVDQADVLVHNFRPGVPERLGIGHGALAARNSRLIYCAVTGYGEEGPLRANAGYDQVLQAMHRPALDIYSSEMVELTESLLRDLSNLFATAGKSYIYISNGHGAWEATLSNVLSRGDKVLVLESGRFAIGWGMAAAAMGAEVEDE